MKQLLLSLQTPQRFTFEDVVIHEGIASAVSTVKGVYSERSGFLPPLFLSGPSGTGKTLLLKTLAELLSGNSPARPNRVTVITPKENSDPFSDLAAMVSESEKYFEHTAGVAVDDVHQMSEQDAAHLWSLSNKLTRIGAPLMLASRESFDVVFKGNQHLTSRIAAGLVFSLEPPDDQARVLILDKMARDRSLRISREVCRYLVTRKSRNVKDLEGILHALDVASLRLKRRITLPLIKLMESEGEL